MKRELKESVEPVISLDVTAMAKEYPQADFNAIRDEFVELGAKVDGDKSTGSLLMVVDGLSKAEIEDVLDNHGIEEVTPGEFIKCDDCIEECDEAEELIDEAEEYVEPDEFDDMIPDYDDVDIEDEDSELLNKCVVALNKALSARVIVSEDDIDDEAYSLIEDVLDGEDPDDLDDEEYENILDMLHNAWGSVDMDIDIDDEDDEYQPRFEKMRRARRMDEKKKPCCPGKKVSLCEALKAFNEADRAKLAKSEKTVKDVIDGIKSTTIGEAEAKDALKKLKAENAKLQKIAKDDKTNFNVKDVPGAQKALRTIAKAGLEKDVKKFEDALKAKVEECLKANKESLHENVRINGKSLADFSVDELKSILEKLEVSVKSLNESADAEAISKKKRLMEYIDQELTYRVTRAKFINEAEEEPAGDVISDEELANMFGPAQGEEPKSEESEEKSDDEEPAEDEEPKSDDAEDDEEVELSRIVITLKSKDAADALKQACVDADIPEDAIEVEAADEPEAEDDEEATEEPEAEDAEAEDIEAEEPAEEEESEEPNESMHYNNIRALLFEGEEPAEEEADDTEDEEGAEDEESEEPAEDGESEEPAEDGQYKFILVNTDYAEELAKVLEDNYGISKEEFEEMIGGEIVKEESDEDAEDEEATEEPESEDKEDNEDKENEDSEEKEDDDEIDTSDLFKGL